jgi:uncharacterized BrkB/YihY/UPF0761 family membrane protein
MLKHPKGYRRYVPPGEVLLAGINMLSLALSVMLFCPSLLMVGTATMTGDHAMPPAYWSYIGLVLILLNILGFYWAFWACQNTVRLLNRPFAWIGSLFILASLFLFELRFIGFWVTAYKIIE